MLFADTGHREVKGQHKEPGVSRFRSTLYTRDPICHALASGISVQNDNFPKPRLESPRRRPSRNVGFFSFLYKKLESIIQLQFAQVPNETPDRSMKNVSMQSFHSDVLLSCNGE